MEVHVNKRKLLFLKNKLLLGNIYEKVIKNILKLCAHIIHSTFVLPSNKESRNSKSSGNQNVVLSKWSDKVKNKVFGSLVEDQNSWKCVSERGYSLSRMV